MAFIKFVEMLILYPKLSALSGWLQAIQQKLASADITTAWENYEGAKTSKW